MGAGIFTCYTHFISSRGTPTKTHLPNFQHSTVTKSFHCSLTIHPFFEQSCYEQEQAPAEINRYVCFCHQRTPRTNLFYPTSRILLRQLPIGRFVNLRWPLLSHLIKKYKKTRTIRGRVGVVTAGLSFKGRVRCVIHHFSWQRARHRVSST